MAHIYDVRTNNGGLRLMSAAIMCMVAASSSAAQAAQPDFGKAYHYALRCFVVTSIPDDANSGKSAYDAVIKLAQLQSLSNEQIQADFHHAMAEEAINITRSPQYKQQLIGECQKLGLAN